MQIIIVHPKLPRARTLTLRTGWVVAAALAGVLVVGAASGLLSYVTLRYAAALPIPFLQPMLARIAATGLPAAALEAGTQGDDAAPPAHGSAPGARTASGVPASEPRARLPVARAAHDAEAILRQSIDALAVRLGELQARLTRLDAIGERVGGMVGIRAQELGRPVPGRGGPLPARSEPLSIDDLSLAIERIARGVEHRADQFSLIESELVLRQTIARLLPSSEPLEDALPGSRYGWRIDPFTGRRALHEGIDFNVPPGTPIVAAGAGVVVFAGWHPAYGRQVDIDHGDGVVTRYAHASRLLVKEGDIVHQGERIALVGSSGRSTGPHLHFEVRVDGEPRDPLAFLQQSALSGRLGARGTNGLATLANGR